MLDDKTGVITLVTERLKLVLARLTRFSRSRKMTTVIRHTPMAKALTGFLLAMVLAGCGSDGGGEAPGSLSVSLTDAGLKSISVLIRQKLSS